MYHLDKMILCLQPVLQLWSCSPDWSVESHLYTTFIFQKWKRYFYILYLTLVDNDWLTYLFIYLLNSQNNHRTCWVGRDWQGSLATEERPPKAAGQLKSIQLMIGNHTHLFTLLWDNTGEVWTSNWRWFPILIAKPVI